MWWNIFIYRRSTQSDIVIEEIHKEFVFKEDTDLKSDTENNADVDLLIDCKKVKNFIDIINEDITNLDISELLTNDLYKNRGLIANHTPKISAHSKEKLCIT